MIDLLVRYAPAFASGLWVTTQLTLIVWSLGIVLGLSVGFLAVSGNPILGRLIALATVVASALPILVVLMWLHFPAQAILHINIDPFLTTSFALTLLNAIFVSDAVTKTVRSLSADLEISARVAGLHSFVIFRKITLPLATRQLVGPILFIQISMLHATIFGSLISVDEIFRTIQRINALEYSPIALYSILALFFLVVCVPLHTLATFLTRKFSADLSMR